MAYFSLGHAYYCARQYDQALAQFMKIAELDSNERLAYWNLAWTSAQAGRYADAVGAMQEFWTLKGTPPEDVEALGRAYTEAGPNGFWTWLLEQLEGKYESNIGFTARFHAQLGNTDQALAWLEKGYEKHDGQMHLLKIDPSLDPLRDDPRFQDLLRRMNFPDDDDRE